ncbi:ATP-binding protein [Vibrio tubiashii]|uniref:ATP-binding protein n=1 Tax=Vibrio tubiashii TaxID=29498 RepID=UPI003CE49808
MNQSVDIGELQNEDEENVLHFEVSSALKSVIGKDLITNDFVAIFELVKNSFDASAANVDIVFEDIDGVVNRIFIIDDGKGMSYDDLINKWLFVAYSAKKDGTEDSDPLRTYAGNKGVGRFSCDRVGGNLKLQSKSAEEDFVHVLDVDWGKFEEDAKDKFEDVAINYDTSSSFSLPNEYQRTLNSGVVLEISDLREASSWDREKLKRLKANLAKLINPFGNAHSPINLNIIAEKEINADEAAQKEFEDNPDIDFPDLVNGAVTNNIFDMLHDRTTSLTLESDDNGNFVTTLTDRGELIYTIQERASLYPELVDSGLSCQIYSLNFAAKNLFKRRTGVRSIDFGSLFLFRNGFRVMPIGDVNDDSWGIDKRHGQGFSRTLGTRDVMGRVDISGPESKFKEKSSRDGGLIETEAKEQLFEYIFTKCVRRLEQYVVGVTWQDSIDKHHDTSQRLNLDENRSNIIELVSKLAGTKEIELIGYSDNLVNVLSEKSSYFESSVEKLAKLAENSSNTELLKNVHDARKRFAELKLAEEEARKIANQELQARIEAEKKAQIERKLREAAEQEADKQRQLKQSAELVAQRESALKHEAEIKADRELELKQKAVEQVNKLNVAYEEEKKRNLFLLSSENRDVEQLESFLHQIVIYTASAKQKVTSTLMKLNKKGDVDKEEVVNSLGELLESVEKIMTTSRFATTANFKLDSTMIDDDISIYIQEYLEKISTAYNSRIQIKVRTDSKGFVTKFTPIELGMVLDNLVSNAKKSRASLVEFSIKNEGNNVLGVTVEDNGKGLDKSIIEKERIFEKGVTTTRGSGLGLFHSKKQVEKMGGEIFIPDEQPAKGFRIKIRLRK